MADPKTTRYSLTNPVPEPTPPDGTILHFVPDVDCEHYVEFSQDCAFYLPIMRFHDDLQTLSWVGVGVMRANVPVMITYVSSLGFYVLGSLPDNNQFAGWHDAGAAVNIGIGSAKRHYRAFGLFAYIDFDGSPRPESVQEIYNGSHDGDIIIKFASTLSGIETLYRDLVITDDVTLKSGSRIKLVGNNDGQWVMVDRTRDDITPPTPGPVLSVFGRVGHVTAQYSDYIDFYVNWTPVDGISYGLRDGGFVEIYSKDDIDSRYAVYTTVDEDYTIQHPNECVLANTFSNGMVVTLPPDPAVHDYAGVWDAANNAEANSIVVLQNGKTIMYVDQGAVIDMRGGRFDFCWNGVTWVAAHVLGCLDDNTQAQERAQATVYYWDFEFPQYDYNNPAQYNWEATNYYGYGGNTGMLIGFQDSGVMWNSGFDNGKGGGNCYEWTLPASIDNRYTAYAPEGGNDFAPQSLSHPYTTDAYACVYWIYVASLASTQTFFSAGSYDVTPSGQHLTVHTDGSVEVGVGNGTAITLARTPEVAIIGWNMVVVSHDLELKIVGISANNSTYVEAAYTGVLQSGSGPFTLGARRLTAGFDQPVIQGSRINYLSVVGRPVSQGELGEIWNDGVGLTTAEWFNVSYDAHPGGGTFGPQLYIHVPYPESCYTLAATPPHKEYRALIQSGSVEQVVSSTGTHDSFVGDGAARPEYYEQSQNNLPTVRFAGGAGTEAQNTRLKSSMYGGCWDTSQINACTIFFAGRSYTDTGATIFCFEEGESLVAPRLIAKVGEIGVWDGVREYFPFNGAVSSGTFFIAAVKMTNDGVGNVEYNFHMNGLDAGQWNRSSAVYEVGEFPSPQLGTDSSATPPTLSASFDLGSLLVYDFYMDDNDIQLVMARLNTYWDAY